SPIFTTSRHRNAYWFNGFQPNATVALRLSFPLGCPLFVGTETLIERNRSVFRFSRAWRHECRIFIEQSETDGVVTVRDIPTQLPWRQRSLLVRGLKNATLRFLPDTGVPTAEVVMLRQPRYPHLSGDFVQPQRIETPFGLVLEAHALSGDLLIAW
ncbi:MAG TPA: hypothetical protein VEA63_15960, partial [Opitutus sp.]|nr:hypothetical protein [Opitutus sp.]